VATCLGGRFREFRSALVGLFACLDQPKMNVKTNTTTHLCLDYPLFCLECLSSPQNVNTDLDGLNDYHASVRRLPGYNVQLTGPTLPVVSQPRLNMVKPVLEILSGRGSMLSQRHVSFTGTLLYTSNRNRILDALSGSAMTKLKSDERLLSALGNELLPNPKPVLDDMRNTN
ncbi:hypothetical protein CPB85DRAFT_1282720, partial [Mucidula mucida]